MSVIIRLQNLPWSANAADVRAFFRGLGIPDGGVHIVGGENGDTFIAFSTDEDARQAMMLDGGKLKETQVHLLLSSRAEMQKVIEAARQQTISSFMNYSQPTVAAAPLIPLVQPQIPVPGIQVQPTITNNPVVSLISDQQLSAVPTKPQPPIITSSSLSGILAQQMLQHQQLQLIHQQQNMPVLTSTSIRHDAYKSLHHNQYNALNQQYGDNAMDSNKNLQRNNDIDSKRGKISRSRSRSRDRKKRSRSRERSRRYRDRSRSRDRRDRRRRRSRSNDRRSRSHGRDTGRDRNSRDSVRKDRVYDKDQRPSLDRNKSVDENRQNFNASQINQIDNKQPGIVDHQKSFNYQDIPGPISNFNTDGPKSFYNNFNNQSRNDFVANTFTDDGNQKMTNNELEPVMPMMPFTHTDNSNNKQCCVKLTNTNYKTHYAAIRKFFYGLQIPNDGIKLLNDENGKRRGEVLIRFVRPDIAREALALDGKMLNGQLVRVLPISDNEYRNEVDSFQPRRSAGSNRGTNRYEDRNINDDNRGGSNVDDNSRDSNYRQRGDRYDRDYQRDRFNRDNDGNTNHSNDSRDGNDDVMVITDSNDGVVTVGTTLLIEDLPPFAKEQDIIKMFSDFTLLDIMLTKVNKLLRAYVKFHNQSDAEAALKQTHMHRIDFKSVFVSVCSDEAYAKAKREYDGIGETTNQSEDVDRQNYNDRGDYRQNDYEVDQFGRNNFKNRKFGNANQQPPQPPPMASNNTTIPSLFNLTFDNVPSLSPNQQMSQGESNRIAPTDPRLRRQLEQNKQSPEPHNISSPNQQKTFNPFNQHGRMDPRLLRNSSLPLPNLTNPTNTKIVFIGNVEYRTTESDIVSFFADIGVAPQDVYFVKNARGQPCGDCYVKFIIPDDATKALIKNRFRFRSRVIRVTLAEPDDAARVLGIKLTDAGDDVDDNDDDGGEPNDDGNEKGTQNIHTKDKSETGNESETNENDDKQGNVSNMDNLVSDFAGQQEDNAENNGNDAEMSDNNDVEQQNNDIDGGRFSDRMDGGNRNGDPRIQYNAPYSRGGNIGDRSGNMMEMNMNNNNFYRGGGGGVGGMSDNNRGGRGGYNQNSGQRNLEGCIVSLNNVPFAATPRDIADFFGEYNLGPNDIIRRFNDDGTLTGEARVRFLTPMDAAEAIQRHQKERIKQRVIHLRLVT